MARIVEPLMHETLRSDFEDRGFEVYGEVTLGDAGRIDLYVITPNGTRWGIEVKNHWNMIAWGNRPADATDDEPHPEDPIKPTAIRELAEQVNRYTESGYCDEVYIATQGTDALQRALKDADNPPVTAGALYDMVRRSTSVDIDSPHELPSKLKWRDESPPDHVGIIQVTPWSPDMITSRAVPSGFDVLKPVVIEDHADSLKAQWVNADTPPSLTQAHREPDVAHRVWSGLQASGDYPVFREAVIPDPTGDRVKQVDIAYLTPRMCPVEVYRNQSDEDYQAVGIEVKCSLSPKQDVVDQLHTYSQSGAFTQLYLCVPEALKRRAKDLLSDNSERFTNTPGLMIYEQDTGNISFVKQSDQRELRYPLLRTSRNKRDESCIFWGIARQYHNVSGLPVYDQR